MSSPQEQARLLDLQRLDQRASALRHRRDAHPSHATLKELAGRAEDLQRAGVAQSATIDAARRDIARIAADIERVRTRRATQQDRIDRNAVPLRDVSALMHEIERMDQRIADLEEEQLGVEEQLEAHQATLEAMKAEAAAIVADVNAAKEQFESDMGDVQAELITVGAERDALAATLPSDLLDDYEYARGRNGALAVIEVRDGVVMTPGTELSPVELDAVRTTPATELYWVDGTSQIVVRTSAKADA